MRKEKVGYMTRYPSSTSVHHVRRMSVLRNVGAIFLRLLFLSATFAPVHSFCIWKSHRTLPRLSLLASEQESSATRTEIKIRDSLYDELSAAVDIIMDAFYAHATPPWNHMYRLAELNRLQQGFPYADRDKHRMLVAVAVDPEGGQDRIVGYCDWDNRTPNQKTAYQFNPRPYVSDLCVLSSFRRQGIANRLVETCEEFCRKSGNDEAYIRVERKNEAAVTLYTNLGYVEFENDLDDSEKIIILRKSLD